MELTSVLTQDDPDFESRVQKNIDTLETNQLRQKGKYESSYKWVWWVAKHQAWKVVWNPSAGQQIAPGMEVDTTEQRKEGFFLLSDYSDMDACRCAAEAFLKTVHPDDKTLKMDKPVFNLPATRFKFSVNNPQFRIHGTNKTVIAIGLVSRLREKWIAAGGEGRDLGDFVIPV